MLLTWLCERAARGQGSQTELEGGLAHRCEIELLHKEAERLVVTRRATRWTIRSDRSSEVEFAREAYWPQGASTELLASFSRSWAEA